MPLLTAALADLTDLLGADRVLTGEDDRRRRGTDESWHEPAPPDAVVCPRSTEEAAAIVRTCARHGVPMVPFGAGTSLEGHVAALRGGVAIDTSAMDRILDLSVADMEVTVQAGVTRLQLDARLRGEGVFFPVDPGADATLGGMVATGASGTMAVRYGTMRENVRSLTVVTAGGEIVRTRSRARKSSAGYDLTRLFVGSEGTLGLIAEATLGIQPTPEATLSARAAFPSLGEAVGCVVEVLQALIPVARIELLDPLQVEAIDRYAGSDHPRVPTLLLELHGRPAEIAASAEEVRAIAAEHGCTDLEPIADPTAQHALWRERHAAYPAALALRPGARGFATDACVPLSRMVECVLASTADAAESGLTAPLTGHVGDGNFHFVVLVDPGDPDELARARAFGDRLARRAIAMGGTCTGEHGIGYGKAHHLEAEHGAAGVAAMRAIKAALDPDGLFNPGKVADA